MHTCTHKHVTRRVCGYDALHIWNVTYCNVNLEPSSSDVLSPCSHMSQWTCQVLIAWAVVDYTADAACNVGVDASCSLGVMQTLWWYAKECVPSRPILVSHNSLWLYLLLDPCLISLFLTCLPRKRWDDPYHLLFLFLLPVAFLISSSLPPSVLTACSFPMCVTCFRLLRLCLIVLLTWPSLCI